MQHFSEIVRATMARKRLKISDLARKTGYSQQYISDLLAGNRRWNETTIDKVCKALNLVVEIKSKEHNNTGAVG
ncbi:helix-turn-helix domain-containing protein [Calderihabitans maritimus]|uniref:HTH cro/C1-type domain-containing protein n=1 Tax=Calderihabitans maritimus TaxID=1246530 RepID=A0A1Z5HSF7_9FIRM|nr:helix-turn-helix transcriptional regulator [Calderihabitans maritimus]GAW92452.1 hypothetical protein C169_24195 [Calderihabitans maritimus]